MTPYEERLCRTCKYGEKSEYYKPCVVYSDDCQLYEPIEEMTRETAIIILKSLKQYYNDKNEDSYVGFDDEDNEALDMAIKTLEQQPKVGEWIDEDTEQGALGIQYTIKRCSKCGWTHGLLIPKNYCPNCGAKMR